MRSGISISATAEDRARLVGDLGRPYAPQKHISQASIIFLAADGLDTTEIMGRTTKSKPCVWRWQERSMQVGMVLTVVLFLSGPSCARAADLTVGPSGQYKTIQAAANAAKPGDTVHVAPGTYNEILTISGSGTANSRLRYLCDAKWECKIWPTQNPNSDQIVVNVTGNYVDFEGFDITSSVVGIRTGLDTNGNNNRIVRNKIHDINTTGSLVGSCLGLYDSEGSVLGGNLIYHCGNHPTMDHGIYVSSGTGTIINNIVGFNAAFGIHLWHTPHHVKIFNNTVFNNGSGGIIVAAVEHADSFIDGCITANNIVFGNREDGIVERGGNTEGSEATNIDAIGTNIFVNNLVFNNGSDYDLMKNSHYGDITGDPMFVNYQPDGSGDYHLKAGSPAIDKADPQYAPTTDAEGKSRCGPPDLGAYESCHLSTGAMPSMSSW